MGFTRIVARPLVAPLLFHRRRASSQSTLVLPNSPYPGVAMLSATVDPVT